MWSRREVGGFRGAECLQKVQRKQESNTTDGAERGLASVSKKLLLFCWTSQLFLTSYPETEAACASLCYPESCRKREIA